MTSFSLSIENLEAQNHALCQLRLFEPINLRSTCSLIRAEEMGFASTSQAMDSLGIKPEDFVQPHDEGLAISSNSLWVWCETSHNNEGREIETKQKAASSPLRLLGNVKGVDLLVQKEALELYEQLFSNMSLLLNDHLVAGWDSVEKMAREDDFRAAFKGNQGDLERAISQNFVWTMVDVESSKVTFAAPTLEGVLARAWEHHPAVIAMTKAREFDQNFPVVPPPRKGLRF